MSIDAHSAPEYRERQSYSFVFAAEIFRGREFEHDSGEMSRCFSDGKPFFASCRIEHHDPSFPVRFQDNKMSHVPVQDSRQPQLSEMTDLDSQRPACQPQVSCYLHEVAESDTFQGHGVPAPQAIHVRAIAMIGCYHGKACQPAFRRLRLPDDREDFASAEIQ